MSLINDALKRARQGSAKPPPESPAEPPLQPVQNPEPERKNSVIVVAGAAVLLVVGSWYLWQWLNPDQPAQGAAAKPPATNQAPAAGKSSLASNLTKPFQAVAKLDAAIQEARKTEAASPKPVQTETPVPAEARSPETKTMVASPTPPPSSSPSATSSPAAANIPPTQVAETTPSTSARSTPAKEEIPLSPTPPAELPAQPISRNVTFPSLKLGGIYLRMSKPSVLINNRTLFLGDTVDGVRVVGIERHSVSVEFKGATNELFLR
jgi:hypothetical protein